MMTDSNLDQLAEQTEKSLYTQSANQKTAKQGSRISSKLVIKALLVLAIVFSLNHIADSLHLKFGVTQAAIQSDLVNILYQAKDSIQPVMAATGEPPLSIPNTALSGLVSYEVTGNKYILRIGLGKNVASLDSDGKLIINGEQQESR